MLRVDLTPGFRSPFSDNAYIPNLGQRWLRWELSSRVHQHGGLSTVYSGRSAAIAVMGPNIESNLSYFVQPAIWELLRRGRDAWIAVRRFQALWLALVPGGLGQEQLRQRLWGRGFWNACQRHAISVYLAGTSPAAKSMCPEPS